MEQQTHNPPEIKDEPVQRPKRTTFQFLIWGEGGGLNYFYFILSKIAIMDTNGTAKTPTPQNQG